MLIIYSFNQSPPRKANLFAPVRREFVITFALCRNNIPANLSVFVGGFIPRLINAPVPFNTGIVVFLRVLMIGLIWDYAIDIVNTTTSVEEDKINKPHRPIPAGLITLRQSQARWALSWCFGPWAVAVLGGKPAALWMIVWQIWLTGFYVWPAYRHWLTKSLMTTGAIFILQRLLNSALQDIPKWQLNLYPEIWICLWTMGTIHLQDFRDIEGDRTTHAITLPILLSDKGQKRLRAATASFLIVGSIGSAFWIWMRVQNLSAYCSGALFYLSSLILAFYTITSSSAYQNRVMYRWWTVALLCIMIHVFDVYLLSRPIQQQHSARELR
jgi:4-hydroxybenzoate polyprenyltransferase